MYQSTRVKNINASVDLVDAVKREVVVVVIYSNDLNRFMWQANIINVLHRIKLTPIVEYYKY